MGVTWSSERVTRPGARAQAALGSAVAAELGNGLGDALVVAHGVQEHALLEHEDAPFDVVGILERTNTPLDRTVFITLAGVGAMHEEYAEHSGDDFDQDEDPGAQERSPATLTAFLVGLESRPDVLRLKREIEEDEDEPLTAVMPAVALHELWTTIGYAERALQAISIAVVITSLISVLISLYSTLQERRREIAVLRAVGLGQRQILLLLTVEAGLLAASGAVLGVAVVYAALFALAAHAGGDDRSTPAHSGARAHAPHLVECGRPGGNGAGPRAGLAGLPALACRRPCRPALSSEPKFHRLPSAFARTSLTEKSRADQFTHGRFGTASLARYVAAMAWIEPIKTSATTETPSAVRNETDLSTTVTPRATSSQRQRG